ncbi:hypothetical protein IY145_24290 [Methylosinus sp. H3A]|nr:hypothetical protein [Methylosinus sp. H3A]
MLHRHADTREISLHYSSEGRSGPMAQAIGAYALDLPLTIHVEPQEEFEQFLSRLQAVLDEDREWLDYAPVVDTGASGASIERLGFEYVSALALLQAGPVSMALEAATTPSPPFRLRLKCRAEKDKLEVELHYNAAQFVAAAIERLIEQWSDCSKMLRELPAATIARLKLMSSAEQERSTHELRSAVGTQSLQAPGLHSLMGRQAKLVPDAPALTCGDESWTSWPCCRGAIDPGSLRSRRAMRAGGSVATPRRERGRNSGHRRRARPRGA